MINAKLQSIIDTKSAIGNAIVNKGGTITGETPFFNYAAQIDGISTGAGVYSNFVAQAQDNSKYTVYTGYDSVTNPTPNLSNNFAFNRWLLNNSATGSVVLSNVVVGSNGTFNGPNVTFNESNMAVINSSVNRGSTIRTLKINNSFIYAGGDNPVFVVSKYHENNLVISANTGNYGNNVESLALNNGFIYAGGGILTGQNRGVAKYHESNLTLVGNTVNYGGSIQAVSINNGFIYAGGEFNDAFSNGSVKKYNESNLAFIEQSANYGGVIYALGSNNSFIYAGGGGVGHIKKYHESNLSFVANTSGITVIRDIKTNNGFVYAASAYHSVNAVFKYHESNLALVGNTAEYGARVESLVINNGFIYVGGEQTFGANGGHFLRKYHESNLALLASSANLRVPTDSGTLVIFDMAINNGFIYLGGQANTRIQRLQTRQVTAEQISLFNITNIKE
jgi:hypothetical protein